MVTVEELFAVECLGALRAQPALTVVFDGEPTKPPPPGPYACWYDGPGDPEIQRLDGTASGLSWTCRVVAAARTMEGLRSAVSAVRTALLDLTPGGSRSTGPLREVLSSDPIVDGTESDRRLSTTLMFRCGTDRSW